ncbi:MAG: cell division protein FtsA [Anaerolineae bacterium]|nr:cell division protein FtsA [Anaerolineae bacterium]NUQ03979.1 cell division protein FtsA [Anaerolineae bacterium]
MNDLVVGIDVGTTKVCTIVGEVRADDIFVVGVGIDPSRGMRKGIVSDINALTQSIAASVHKAERASGYEIKQAFVSVAGNHIASMNSRGTVSLPGTRSVRDEDLDKALEQARSIAIPHNREVLHVIPRTYALDDHHNVRSPIGMHGFRLEVEVHIITAASTSLANLEQAVRAAGVIPDRFILNPLASGDAVLTPQEREMGVVLVDIGGGTTDIAIFIEGTVWHSAVLAIGGDLITNDITHWMHAPYEVAEEVKLRHSSAQEKIVSQYETFMVQPFGEGLPTEYKLSELAMVTEARASEIFEMVQAEMKRSGYAGLLRAGVVLTGGCALLPGIRDLAADILDCPVRIAKPEQLTGMADALRSPAYSTSVGLLRLGLQMDSAPIAVGSASNGMPLRIGSLISGFFKRLLPDDEK